MEVVKNDNGQPKGDVAIEQPMVINPDQEFLVKIKASQVGNLMILMEGGLVNMNTLINTLENVFRQAEGKATHDQMLKDMWEVKQYINGQITEQLKQADGDNNNQSTEIPTT